MSTKQHPADVADIEKIAQAIAFNVHLRTGPTEKINRRAKTLAAAVRIADQLGTTPGGRKPLIYAVTADKLTVHVPTRMIAEARQGAADSKKGGGAAVEALAGADAASKPHRAPRTGAGARPKGKRAEIAENAAKSILPPPPDFSAETHKRYRGKLAEIIRLVEAGDVAALKAIEIKTYSSSPKALDRYRNLALRVLEARADA